MLKNLSISKRKAIIALAVIFFALILVAISYPNSNPKSKEVKPALKATAFAAKMGNVQDNISVIGKTIAREEVLVLTELTGFKVSDVFADVGDEVKKGQKLIALDGESLANQLAQLEGDFVRARDEYYRSNKLKESGAISNQELVQKRTLMQTAKARYDDAMLSMKRATIVAPEAGVVYERNARIGEIVSANQPLFRIAKNSDIEASFDVPETDVAMLKKGQKVSITLDDNVFDGQIRLITPSINQQKRTSEIRASFAEADLPKLPKIYNFFARAEIIKEDVNGVLIPTTALQTDSKGDFVWKIGENNKAHRNAVVIEARKPDFSIVKNLDKGARVVAKAGMFVKEGDIVEIIEN